MSSRLLFSARPARTFAAFTGQTQQVLGRGFQISTTAKTGLKESSTYDPDANEKHKNDSLSKQKAGKGHWKPELASDSEEAIKADRDAATDPATLQERTKRAAEETSKAGTSMRDGL